MSPHEILTYISPEFHKFVLKQGWTPVAGRYEDRSFGNAFVDIDAFKFTLMLIKDRDQYFIEIGSARNGRRFDLPMFLEFFKIIDPILVRTPNVSRLNAVIAAMSENLEFISNLFISDVLDRSGFFEFYLERQAEDIEQLRERSRLVRLGKSKNEDSSEV